VVAADQAGHVAVQQEAGPPNLCIRRVGNRDQLELAVHRHGAVVVVHVGDWSSVGDWWCG
jgi:hypothetical protein